MAVSKHPSVKPGLPRKPPATSTTDGGINTVSKTGTGDGMMEYGSRNGGDLRITKGAGAERANDFKAYTSNEGKAPKPGKASPNEGGQKDATKAPRPGDQKSNDEPG